VSVLEPIKITNDMYIPSGVEDGHELGVFLRTYYSPKVRDRDIVVGYIESPYDKEGPTDKGPMPVKGSHMNAFLYVPLANLLYRVEPNGVTQGLKDSTTLFPYVFPAIAEKAGGFFGGIVGTKMGINYIEACRVGSAFMLDMVLGLKPDPKDYFHLDTLPKEASRRMIEKYDTQLRKTHGKGHIVPRKTRTTAKKWTSVVSPEKEDPKNRKRFSLDKRYVHKM
jgi:hypothetical protein